MDREKVIGHLNDCMEASRADNGWVFVRKDIIADVLALLKEQEAEIDEISDEYLDLGKEMAKQPEIVRCKDCRWWDKREGSHYGYCQACQHGYSSGHWEIGIYRSYRGDFFCADGERRS